MEAAGVVDLVTSEGKSEKNRERLQELCARVLATGERTVTASDIAGLCDFPFDKFQVSCKLRGRRIRVQWVSS